MDERGSRAVLRCEYCGKEWSELKSQLLIPGKGRFCSASCKYDWRTDKAKMQRVCKACGNVFLVGGRGRGAKDQELCSDACQRASRYRRGKACSELTKEQAAYIAGIMDGEGSVMIASRGDHRSYSTLISVTNTSRPLLDWLLEKTAIGGVHDQHVATDKRKATWFWRCWGDGAVTLLKQISPYLVVKRRQADLAIAFQERLRNQALKADRTWQREWMQKMQAFNKRGPIE